MYPLTKYCDISERKYFDCKLLILFISTFSFLLFLYSIWWRYKRDYFLASIDILFEIMFYIVNMMKKHYSFKPHLCLQYKKVPDLNWSLYYTIYSYAPVYWYIYFLIMTKLLTSMHPNIKGGCF